MSGTLNSDINYAEFFIKEHTTAITCAMLIMGINPYAYWGNKESYVFDKQLQVLIRQIESWGLTKDDKGFYNIYDIFDKAIRVFGLIPNEIECAIRQQIDLLLDIDKEEFLKTYRYISNKLSLTKKEISSLDAKVLQYANEEANSYYENNELLASQHKVKGPIAIRLRKEGLNYSEDYIRNILVRNKWRAPITSRVK